jgi:regulator of replication initiation timing
VVLEENNLLRESLEQKEARLAETERAHIKEVGRLAKRLIVAESEKVNVLGQLDLFRENHDELLKKFQRASVELQRRVTLEDHLGKTADLQRKIEEIGLCHRQEMEISLAQLEATKTELTNLGCKYTSVMGENRKLEAENEVLEKALEHGAGRKAQRKLQDLESRLEAAQQTERLAQVALERLARDADKLAAENKGLVAAAKAAEQEAKRLERRLFEEGLRASRCEERFVEFKEKAASTLARSMHKSEARQDKLCAAKVQSERKLNDIVNLLERKQTQIDGYLVEKK